MKQTSVVKVWKKWRQYKLTDEATGAVLNLRQSLWDDCSFGDNMSFATALLDFLHFHLLHPDNRLSHLSQTMSKIIWKYFSYSPGQPSHSRLLSGNYWFLGLINNQEECSADISAHFMNEFLSKLQKLFPQTRGMPDLGVIWRQYECMKFFRFQKCGSYNHQFVTTRPPQFIAPSPKVCPSCYKSIVLRNLRRQ